MASVDVHAHLAPPLPLLVGAPLELGLDLAAKAAKGANKRATWAIIIAVLAAAAAAPSAIKDLLALWH